MTEHGAAAWAKRLLRVWCSGVTAKRTQGVMPNKKGPNGYLWIQLQFEEMSVLCVFGDEGTSLVRLIRSVGSEREEKGRLEFISSSGWLSTKSVYLDDDNETFARFADELLPFFRRGCWLSGCDIEASAHEKAEWM